MEQRYFVRLLSSSEDGDVHAAAQAIVEEAKLSGFTRSSRLYMPSCETGQIIRVGEFQVRLIMAKAMRRVDLLVEKD